jgi:transcriptional regulator with XRE-family HTH domain
MYKQGEKKWSGMVSTAKRLQELIDYYGISAAELSKSVGIAKSSISMWLSGQRTMRQDKIGLIAKHYDIDPAWLMGYDVPMRREKDIPQEDPGIVVTDKDNRFSIHFRDGKTMSDEDKELLKEQLENTIDIFYKLRGIDKK